VKSQALTMILLASGLACGADEPDLFRTGRWVDLSHDFSAETIYWPTGKPFTLDVVSAGRTPAGYYYAANNFSAAEHGGTHLDAPVHFAEGRLTTDQIPLDRLIGPAVVVDVRKGAEANRDYRVDVAALRAWSDHRMIPESTIVLIRTGWSRRWPDRAAYLGTSRTGAAAVPELHFPGIDSAAARWLVEGRKVRAVGIDTPSIDAGQSRTFPTHQILAAANIPAFENLTNLDQLPETGSFIVALPMKIRGGSGGPLRIVALAPR
jgi:kynurenine formamidase